MKFLNVRCEPTVYAPSHMSPAPLSLYGFVKGAPTAMIFATTRRHIETGHYSRHLYRSWLTPAIVNKYSNVNCDYDDDHCTLNIDIADSDYDGNE